MKYIKFITLSIILLIVLIAFYAVIRIWDISLPDGWNLSTQTLTNIILTVGVADALLILLLIFVPFITGGPKKKIDEQHGKVAQRIED